MERLDSSLTDQQLDELDRVLEKEDVDELKKICEELEIELEENEDINAIAYKLVEYIEKSDELVELLRELSKEKKSFKKLLPYYQKVDNMRFFLDHKDEYQLNYNDLKKMEEFYNSAIKKNRSEKLKKHNKKMDTYWKKYGFGIMLILEIFLTIITYSFFIRQYFVIYVTKKADVAKAIVLEDERYRYAGDYLTVNWKVKYEYEVNDVKYVNHESATIMGLDVFIGLEKDKYIKVYYQKDNPNNARVYQYGGLWNVATLGSSFLVIMIFKKLIFWKRDNA